MNWIERLFDEMCGKRDEEKNGKAPDFPEFPKPSDVRTIRRSKTITSNTSYNGDGIQCKGMGDGGQGEGQQPAFKVKGKTLSDLVLLKPGVDGIHCYGSSTLKNIVWDDIGEDGFTLHGDKLKVVDCMARDGADKWGQVNGARSPKTITLTIKDCSISHVERVIRLNGGNNARAHTLKLFLDGCHFRDCRTIAKASKGKCIVEFKNCIFDNVREPWIGCETKDKGGNKFYN